MDICGAKFRNRDIASKLALSRAIAYKPSLVTIYTTDGANLGKATSLPKGTKLHIMGPNPHYRPSWEVMLIVDKRGQIRVKWRI